LTQVVAEAATALSLNQDVYRALVAMDLSLADPGTTHYVNQTLLNYRLAGVDKDDDTRAHLRELSDKATELSLTFAKHVQENVNRVEVRDPAELEGLPQDYIRNHPPDEKGVITLTTDFPDMQPVMTFAANSDLRLRMFRAYNTRAYPANRELLLDLLAVRQQVATILGFASWADLATANQMMGSAAKMKNFIGHWSRLRAPAPRRNTRWSWLLHEAGSRAWRDSRAATAVIGMSNTAATPSISIRNPSVLTFLTRQWSRAYSIPQHASFM